MNKAYTFLVGILLVGCTSNGVSSASELLAFVNDKNNGTIKEERSGDLNLTLRYHPSELVSLAEVDTTVTPVDSVQKQRDRFDSQIYFILSLSINGEDALQVLSRDARFSQLTSTLAFQMDRYVNLTTSGADTVYVNDFAMSRMYGLSKSTDLIFSFDKKKTKDQDWVQFNLNEFGLNTGNKRFRFNMKDLERVPTLMM
jgi:hypothetical protein